MNLNPAAFRAAVAGLAALLLSACSGPGGSGGSTPLPAWAAATFASNFNSTAAATFLGSAEFQAVDADCAFYGCGVAGAPGTQPNAYALHNVHVAHGAGLSGNGKLVAVVDNGFRLTHQEFSDKTITTYGTLPVKDHGTHVAALIAADKDGAGMYGVAYNADLHFTSFDFNDDTTFDIANVIGGTLDAAGMGAVAQNNSWGFEVQAGNLKTYLDGNPGAVAAGLNALVGYGTSNWQSYINALNTFQNNGVIVWGMSNDDAYSQGDILGTLPYFQTSLAEAWITAVNGYYEVDGSGKITDAVRISAACGYAASFCLAGDGTTNAAESASDSDYGTGTGTSYVAPQISASVAILAEAFPSLTPAEWTDRLLASADNSWFSGVGVTVNGTTNFGGGVTHAYSNEWGHGVLDLEAALNPIGGVSVHSGVNINDSGSSTPVGDAGVSTSSAFGDGLQVALAGKQIAVFDALNANFAMDAGTLVQPAKSAVTASLMSNVSLTGTGSARENSHQPLLASFAQEINPGLGASFAATSNLALTYGASPDAINAARTSVLGLAKTAATGAMTQDLGAASLSLFAFAADHDNIENASLSGVGAKLAFDTGAGKISVGMRQMSESGGLLGFTGSDAFDFGNGSVLSALELGFEQQLMPSLSIFGSLEYGLASTSGFTGDTLVAGVGAVNFSGFEAGVSLADVARAGDKLTFSLAQPLRIESGSTSLNVPVGRTKDGTILYDQLTAELAPTGRELDLSLAYTSGVGETGIVRLGASYARDAGHIAGASAYGMAASYGNTF